MFAIWADVDLGFGFAVQVDVGGREAVAGVGVLGGPAFPFALLGCSFAHGDHAVGDGHGAFGHGEVMDFAGGGLAFGVVGRVAGGQQRHQQ